MLATLIGMAAIIAIGLLWRALLGGKDAEAIRSHLAQAVYSVFLPALVLRVMWQTTISLDVLRVPVVAAVGVLLSLLLAALIYGDGKRVGGKKAVGALLLASAFGNVTYLGLPVLTKTFGAWSQSVAIPYDLFANTPLLFTVGVMLAGHFGSAKQAAHPLIELLRVPALWAAVGGVLLSLFGVSMPVWLDESLAVLEDHDLYLRAAAAFPIGYVDDVLLEIYQHANSLGSGVERKKAYYCRWLLHRKIVRLYSEQLKTSQVAPAWQRQQADLYRNLANLACRNGQHRRAMVLLCTSIHAQWWQPGAFLLWLRIVWTSRGGEETG